MSRGWTFDKIIKTHLWLRTKLQGKNCKSKECILGCPSPSSTRSSYHHHAAKKTNPRERHRWWSLTYKPQDPKAMSQFSRARLFSVRREKGRKNLVPRFPLPERNATLSFSAPPFFFPHFQEMNKRGSCEAWGRIKCLMHRIIDSSPLLRVWEKLNNRWGRRRSSVANSSGTGKTEVYFYAPRIYTRTK